MAVNLSQPKSPWLPNSASLCPNSKINCHGVPWCCSRFRFGITIVGLAKPFYWFTPHRLHRDEAEPLSGASFLWAQQSMPRDGDPFKTASWEVGKPLAMLGARLFAIVCSTASEFIKHLLIHCLRSDSQTREYHTK